MADSNVSSGESEQDTPTEQKPKHPGGRPRIYQSPEEMSEAIEEYFRVDPEPTVTGLALHLGFASRVSLLSYQGYSEEFFNIIKRGLSRVENRYERACLNGKGTGGGPIFLLKNMGWRDERTENVNGEMIIEVRQFGGSSEIPNPE